MKIAYIYTAICTMGGVDRVLTVKANYLADVAGHEVYIITESQAGKPLSFPLSPKVRHIDLGVDFDEQYHKPNLWSRYLCYRRLMREYRRRLTDKLMELRPDVVSTTCGREMDFLCDIKDGSKKVGESHIAKDFVRNFHLMEARGFPHNWIARYYRAKQERAIARLDAFVVLSQYDADSWAPVRKCEVIPNPLTIPEASHH
ncbi:MAG: glycosyltransferase, partial [Bacteroidaceae bacterium]|nr:glycosyltransferase [Bacteroidaceae bacterium]